MYKQKVKIRQNSKGITLIALVITIIVLLILAAVSIATLTGDNGILTKADTAKTQTTEEQEREEVKLAYGATVTEKLSKGDTSNVTADELNIELSKQNTQATATAGTTEGDIDVTFSETNHKYTVHQSGDEKGSITGPEEGEVPNPKEPPKTAKELYNGYNNPTKDGENYDENTMHIGDYVNYDAGNWSEGKAKPTEDFTFGGYGDDQSRNTNATGGDGGESKYSGWRIWDITEEGAVTLISAGCPELYYHPYGTNYAYISEYILTENINEKATDLNLGLGSEYMPRDWSMYKNGHEYVKEARAMKKSDLDEWYNKYIDDNITDSYNIDSFPANDTDKLISVVENGMYYWLCSAHDAIDVCCVSVSRRCVSCADAVAHGVRVLVTLNSEVKYDKATESEKHDGFTYNKWNIITE